MSDFRYDPKKVSISPHAVERAKERFKCKDKVEALNLCKSLLGRAKYIGRVTSLEGEESIMCTVDKNVILLDVDRKIIKSIIDYDTHGHYHGLHDKIKRLYTQEFNKIDRVERSRTKKLEFEKIKSEAEIANLKLRCYKTRSKNVKNECRSAIGNIHKQLELFEDELKKIQSNKRELARAMATVVF